MLLSNVNVSLGWVNGCIAKVIDFNDNTITIQSYNTPTNTLIVERIERTIPYSSYSRTQFPLTLAWGFTIHKVQSLTISTIAIDINNLFAHGHLYVALSRVRHLSNIYIINWKKHVSKRKFNYNVSTLQTLRKIENETANT